MPRNCKNVGGHSVAGHPVVGLFIAIAIFSNQIYEKSGSNLKILPIFWDRLILFGMQRELLVFHNKTLSYYVSMVTLLLISQGLFMIHLESPDMKGYYRRGNSCKL